MNNLQLFDYQDGYKFRHLCQRCQYQWYEDPTYIRQHPYTHDKMYLDELEALVPCPNCKQANSKITPILIRATHSFVGGLA